MHPFRPLPLLVLRLFLFLSAFNLLAGEKDIDVGYRMKSLIAGDETFSNVRITSISEENIVIIHKGGASTVHMASLPEDIRIRLAIPPAVSSSEKEIAVKPEVSEIRNKYAKYDLTEGIGTLGGRKLSYTHKILDGSSYTGSIDADGAIEMMAAGSGIWLYYYNTASPENRNKNYRGQFPGQGLLELNGDETLAFTGLLLKFIDWNEVADKENLREISKELGKFGRYQMTFYRNKEGQGSCGVSVIYNEQTDNFKESLESSIAIFPPAVQGTLYLISQKEELMKSEQEKKQSKEDAQAKADSVLK